MGTGRELGLQLRSWMESGSLGLDNGQALANRLVDALGAEEGLKGPVRDLASQPLLRQLLRRRGEPSLTAVEALTSHLARTYTPAVLAELHDLIEAATGITPPAPPTPATPPLNARGFCRRPTPRADVLSSRRLLRRGAAHRARE